jgi:hypothetical protein
MGELVAYRAEVVKKNKPTAGRGPPLWPQTTAGRRMPRRDFGSGATGLVLAWLLLIPDIVTRGRRSVGAHLRFSAARPTSDASREVVRALHHAEDAPAQVWPSSIARPLLPCGSHGIPAGAIMSIIQNVVKSNPAAARGASRFIIKYILRHCSLSKLPRLARRGGPTESRMRFPTVAIAVSGLTLCALAAPSGPGAPGSSSHNWPRSLLTG